MRFLMLLALTPALFGENAYESMYRANRRMLLATAGKMPEHWYSFRPTKDVRSFQEVFGHLLDVLNSICAEVSGKPSEARKDLEHTTLAKAEFQAEVNKTFSACDAAYGVPAPDLAQSKALSGGLYHTGLHYGNLITYMRLRGLTPPHTEEAQKKGTAATVSSAQPKMVKYYMGFLKRAANPPTLPPDQAKELQKAHIGHLEHMAGLGKLVVAGPFGDNGEIRGILIFRGAEPMEELKALAEQDPAVKAGRLVVELHPWYVEEHILP